MTVRRLPMLIALALPVTLCAQQPDLDRAAQTITEEDYMRHVLVMAHDSMRGRDTPSPGLEQTAAYLAAQLEAMGLRGGAADGSFLQRYPLRSTVVDRSRSYLRRGDVRLEFGADVLPLLGDVMNGDASAPLAVVSGSGDARAGLTEDAVGGRHALLVLGRAAAMDQNLYRNVVSLVNVGATSVLVVSPASDEAWAASAPGVLASEVSRGWGPQAGPVDRPFVPVLQLRAAAAVELIRGSGLDLAALQARGSAAMRVDHVAGAQATVSLHYADEEVTAPNVVAVLDGGDPGLRSEYVVVSAHMDHVGVGTPNSVGDSIYNGADDNASGTTAVLEIAEAMASLPAPPRRSLMFLLVSGEEKGLWGSEYFAQNPPVAMDRVVADLNMDMVGRNWPDTIVAIGKEHSDLGATLERVNRAHPELGMTAIDDLWPEQSFYTRSDHYNFAREGVPILFFFNGIHDDYHGPEDEAARINAEKAARIARLVFFVAVDVANRTERPSWNPASYRQIVRPSG